MTQVSPRRFGGVKAFCAGVRGLRQIVTFWWGSVFGSSRRRVQPRHLSVLRRQSPTGLIDLEGRHLARHVAQCGHWERSLTTACPGSVWLERR
jgi:hypothetical protein